jgi:hypothetical protein
VSKPKIVVSDSGLAGYLCGADPEGLERDISSAVTGGVVEGSSLRSSPNKQAWSRVDFTLHHYRDTHDRKVDIVLENRRREVVANEVKAATSITERHFRGLELLREKVGARFIAGALLHTGPRASYPLWRTPLGAPDGGALEGVGAMLTARTAP